MPALDGDEQRKADSLAQSLAEEARIRAENERKVAIVKSELNKCLLYILKNDAIEKFVTEENKAHFLKEAGHLLETSTSFTTFQNNVLTRSDYPIIIYSQFKADAGRSMLDFKIRLTPTEIQFDKEDLTTVFCNAVITVERTLTAFDAGLRAHQETVKSQAALAQAAIESKHTLSRMQEEQQREHELQHKQHEEQRRRQKRAAQDARMRATAQMGFKIIAGNTNLF